MTEREQLDEALREAVEELQAAELSSDEAWAEESLTAVKDARATLAAHIENESNS